MKKILLINPPLYFSEDGTSGSLDVSLPPLGLLYLASYINKYSDNFRAEIMDAGAEKLSLGDVKRKILAINPFVIGISAMTPQLQGALELGKMIKKNNRGGTTQVFLGGPHVSADPVFLKRHPGIFDYAITGEAEKTFLASLEKLAEGEKIPEIQSGEALENLDIIPFPDHNLIRKEKYAPINSMLFSRGCPFQCYYCSRPSISRKVRYRSVDNLMEEIKLYCAKGRRKIYFQDDTFTLRRDKVEEFCRKVKEEKLELDWECNTRIDLSDDGILKLMREAGCSQINFGIESGSERVRKEIINKGNFTNEKIREVFASCRKYGIRIACYFMLGHPTETEEEIRMTRDMILNSRIDILGISIPTPFPGSSLYEIAKREGIVNEEIIDEFAEKKLGLGYVGVYPVYIPVHMSSDYIFNQMKEINRKFYVNFETFWKYFKEDVSSWRRLKNDARNLFSLIWRGISARKSYVKKD